MKNVGQQLDLFAGILLTKEQQEARDQLRLKAQAEIAEVFTKKEE